MSPASSADLPMEQITLHQANVTTIRLSTAIKSGSDFTFTPSFVSTATVLSFPHQLLIFLPAAGLLVILQFTPAIRQKWRLVHRINGYIIVLLALIANAGAIMIAREAFGGTMVTQSWVGALFILTTVGLGLAIYNIKMLQIDQHRAWMLRTWFYVRLNYQRPALQHKLTQLSMYLSQYSLRCPVVRFVIVHEAQFILGYVHVHVCSR